MRLFLMGCLFFLLSACASTANYQKKIDTWQGKNIQALISKWGEPDTGIQLPNGHRIYQYTRKTMYSIPDPKRSPLRTDNGNLFSNYDEPWNTHQTVIRSCQTSFETTADG
ncbi:MAG: hypothetical protein K0U11_03055, partial [Gammaproteobacteria bacterium]|nr:hypothetical protein [Gammaproteobacteria bacterium]